MQKWTIAAAAAALTLASTPAQAGWRGAEWGMTLKQVQALQPKAEIGYWRDRKVLKTGEREFADWTWDSVTYLFDRNGKLIEVRLDSASLDRERLLPYLVAQFGAPVANTDATMTTKYGATVFRDGQRGNIVTVEDIGGDLVLRYTPAKIAFF